MSPQDLLCPDCGHHLHRPKPGHCQWRDCPCDAVTTPPHEPRHRNAAGVEFVTVACPACGFSHAHKAEAAGAPLRETLERLERLPQWSPHPDIKNRVSGPLVSIPDVRGLLHKAVHKAALAAATPAPAPLPPCPICGAESSLLPRNHKPTARAAAAEPPPRQLPDIGPSNERPSHDR